jgi:hypothetical protein
VSAPDPSYEEKLEAWCRQNMVRIEVYASGGYGCLDIKPVDDPAKACVDEEVADAMEWNRWSKP